MFLLKAFILVVAATTTTAAAAAADQASNNKAFKPPHIVWIMADDLGYNDISVHGSPQIPTPHIDAIANEGVLLANYHVQPVCSPTRSSALSARHAIHHGIYMPISQGAAISLNTSFTLLPTYLKRAANYSSHIVGKVHLGFQNNATMPTSKNRGFDSHTGYQSGAEDYVNHTTSGAYDFFQNFTIDTKANGIFSTYLFTDAAIDIINSFGPGGYMSNSGQPLFLYLAYQNVHWPLEAPQSYIDKFANATGGDTTRQMVCAMANFLDDAVGNVTAAIKAAGLEEDTLIIFTSDNGGPTHGDEGTSSNNYPLRGGKNTLWTGGVRVIGMIKGAGIVKTGYVNTEKIHVTDWLPSLVTMASDGQDWHQFIANDEPPYLPGDGMNLWDTLANGSPSPRDWLLFETHQETTSNRLHGDALVVGDWKLLKWNTTMPQDENGWFPPPGQDPSKTSYTTNCNGPVPTKVDPSECNKDWCLFNITQDPCEYNNVASQYPDVVQQLRTQLAVYSATAVPAVEPNGCSALQIPMPDGSPGLAWYPCDGKNSDGTSPLDVYKGALAE